MDDRMIIIDHSEEAEEHDMNASSDDDEEKDEEGYNANSAIPGFSVANYDAMTRSCTQDNAEYANMDLLYFTLLYIFNAVASDVFVVPPSCLSQGNLRYFNNNSYCSHNFLPMNFPLDNPKVESRIKVCLIPIWSAETNHISLIVWTKKTGGFFHYDSLLGRHDNSFVHSMVAKLYAPNFLGNFAGFENAPSAPLFCKRKTVGDIMTYIRETPQQSDGWSCGFYTIAIARIIIQRASQGNYDTINFHDFNFGESSSLNFGKKIEFNHYVSCTRKFIGRVFADSRQLYLISEQLVETLDRPTYVTRLQKIFPIGDISLLNVLDVIAHRKLHAKIQMHILQRSYSSRNESVNESLMDAMSPNEITSDTISNSSHSAGEVLFYAVTHSSEIPEINPNSAEYLKYMVVFLDLRNKENTKNIPCIILRFGDVCCFLSNLEKVGSKLKEYIISRLNVSEVTCFKFNPNISGQSDIQAKFNTQIMMFSCTRAILNILEPILKENSGNNSSRVILERITYAIKTFKAIFTDIPEYQQKMSERKICNLRSNILKSISDFIVFRILLDSSLGDIITLPCIFDKKLRNDQNQCNVTAFYSTDYVSKEINNLESMLVKSNLYSAAHITLNTLSMSRKVHSIESSEYVTFSILEGYDLLPKATNSELLKTSLCVHILNSVESYCPLKGNKHSEQNPR
jgi:hypothetical protein